MLPWTELHRPTELEGIKSHTGICETLNKFIEHNTLPHLLLYGPPGTGKTSMILCCARKLYGNNYQNMVLIINASNERGIDTVRTTIKNFVISKTGLISGYVDMFRIVILDEIDSMTSEAQGMLRQTIEKYSKTTRFCLICNDINKVNTALQSRCAMFRFTLLKNEHIRDILMQISNEHNVGCSKDIIDTIIDVSGGDMRAAINTLQHISLIKDRKIKHNDIYMSTSQCNPDIILKCVSRMDKYIDKGKGLSLIINLVREYVTSNNITVTQFLNKMANYIIDSDNYTVDQKIFLVNNLARCEQYDSVNVSLNNSITDIVVSYILARKLSD